MLAFPFRPQNDQPFPFRAGHPPADCVTVRRRRPGWSGEGWSSPSSSRPPRRHSISALEKSWNVWITRIPGIACRVDFYFVVCLKLNWWCLWMRCFIGTSGTIWNSRRADCISLQIGSWNLGSERQAVHGVSHPTNIFRYLQVEALFISFHSRVFPTTCAIGFCALFRDIKLWWLPERGTETQRRDKLYKPVGPGHSPTADTHDTFEKRTIVSPDG